MSLPDSRRTEFASQDADVAECGARFLTIEELSAATTLSVSTIRRLVKKGIIISHQPGGPRHRILFPPDAIELAVKSAQQPDASHTTNPNSQVQTDQPQRGPRPKWTRRN